MAGSLDAKPKRSGSLSSEEFVDLRRSLLRNNSVNASSGAVSKNLVSERKRRKKLKLARLRRKVKSKTGYEYSSNGDIAGVLFLEIQKCTDLPPERNGKSPDRVLLHKLMHP